MTVEKKSDILKPFRTSSASNGDYVRIKIYGYKKDTWKIESLITWWEIRNHRMTYGGTCWGTGEFTDLPSDTYPTFKDAVEAIKTWLKDNPRVPGKGVSKDRLIITTGTTTNWRLPEGE